MERAEFNKNDIHPIDLRLLDGQVKMVLEALTLYGYNLKYMINEQDFKLSAEEISRKNTMLQVTYEAIRCSLVDQLEVGEKSNSYTKTEGKIINLIKSNKNITQPEIAKILNLSVNCIYRNIKNLKEKNILIRIGANKNGFWEIRDNFKDKCKDNFIDFDKIVNI